MRTPKTKAYLDAQNKLEEVRKQYGDSPEEDKHLDEMDALWNVLSPEEIQELEKMGEAPSGA